MRKFVCEDLPNPARRSFVTAVSATGAALRTGFSTQPANAPSAGDPKFMEEATWLATESVEKGWGGPFGAVIVKDGEIIGRGQNRVLSLASRLSR